MWHENGQKMFIDSYLTGGIPYILDTGFIGMGISVVTIPIVAIGIVTTNVRAHNIMATIIFAWSVLIAFGNFEFLSS